MRDRIAYILIPILLLFVALGLREIMIQENISILPAIAVPAPKEALAICLSDYEIELLATAWEHHANYQTPRWKITIDSIRNARRAKK